jgi:hypothetical protein
VSRGLFYDVSRGVLTGAQWLWAPVSVEVAGLRRRRHRPSSDAGDGQGGVGDGHDGKQAGGVAVRAGGGGGGWVAAAACG